jgi:integrase/recombinase XerC
MSSPEIEGYLHELHVLRQLSPHTLKAYQSDLMILLENTQVAKITVHQVCNALIRHWIAGLHAKGLSARTIARVLSAWRGFYDWLLLEGKAKSSLGLNPVADVKAPKRTKLLPKALSVEQAIALVEHAAQEASAKKTWEFYRDHALLELLYSSGLRLSELLGLDIEPSRFSLGWLDWSVGEVSVLGKGKKRRTIPVGKPAMKALEQWRRQRHAITYKDEPALFVSIQGRRLSPRTVQSRLRSLAIRAGLPTHVHPHMMRHSFASHVLQSSHDLRAVQEMLGHASIASTQIYTALDFQHLAQAYDSAHPRAKVKSSQ